MSEPRRVVIQAEAVFIERRERHLRAAAERDRLLRQAQESSRGRSERDEETRVQRNVGLALGFGIGLVAIAGIRVLILKWLTGGAP